MDSIHRSAFISIALKRGSTLRDQISNDLIKIYCKIANSDINHLESNDSKQCAIKLNPVELSSSCESEASLKFGIIGEVTQWIQIFGAERRKFVEIFSALSRDRSMMTMTSRHLFLRQVRSVSTQPPTRSTFLSSKGSLEAALGSWKWMN